MLDSLRIIDLTFSEAEINWLSKLDAIVSAWHTTVFLYPSSVDSTFWMHWDWNSGTNLDPYLEVRSRDVEIRYWNGPEVRVVGIETVLSWGAVSVFGVGIVL